MDPVKVVVVGVDGAGRTHRLDQIATATAGPVVRVDDPTEPVEELIARLDGTGAGGMTLLVDDAHRLPAAVLRALTRAARQGVELAVARRPTVDRPELAELDEAVTASGSVELLEPMDEDDLATMVVGMTGRPAEPARVRMLHEASCGLPTIAAALVAAGWSAADAPPPVLVARVQQRLAMLEPASVGLARIVALGLDTTDDVLIQASGVTPAAFATSMRELRDAGLMAPHGERMVPAVAQAVLAELQLAERRRLHDAVAGALVAVGGDPVASAAQLSAAGTRTSAAARVYAAAADELRFTDPSTAMTWYDQALEAGAGAGTVTAGRAEAAVLLGRPFDADTVPDLPEDAARVALAVGAAAAHQGRLDRSAEALLSTRPPGPSLAVPALVAVGRHAEAVDAAAGDAPTSVRRLAEAALAVDDPVASLPLLIEAAEALEQAPPTVVLPDTPHAIGAVVAVLVGDGATAQRLLERAVTASVGGPVADIRHRALLAWARMRAGRYDTATAELPHLMDISLAGRDRLMAAALSAGIARRSGDIGRLREAWAVAEPVLARQAVDLFVTEALEELLVAAARLRERRRLAPTLEALDTILAGLGRPPAWVVAVGWIRLQIAVVGEDVAAAESAAGELDMTAPGHARARAQRVAAGRWARVLAGDVEPDGVLAAAEGLAAVELPWEASRLAGHAAVRTGEPAVARRLLERARELVDLDVLTGEGRPDGSRGGLSDREVEVAGLVLAGRTYKEIGAQLYLSPKTVEHHVARIRTKLGATSRADLIAALRRILPQDP